MLHFQKIQSPIGIIFIVADQMNLFGVIFGKSWPQYLKSMNIKGIILNEGETRITKKTARQLDEYFAGRRKSFDLPCRFEGTEFQKQVWGALCDIPYGHTISYKEQAASISRPKATRAVGGTNGKNPISIIVPCHRVVGSSGHLTGFAGGLNKKAFLLNLEGVTTITV